MHLIHEVICIVLLLPHFHCSSSIQEPNHCFSPAPPLLYNCPHFALAFLGASRRDVAVTTANLFYTPAELAKQAAATKYRLIIMQSTSLTTQEALELLIELAGTEPRFLQRQLVDAVGVMLQIAEAESLEEGTRYLAIESMIKLVEARERAPGMMRKLSQFISRLFAKLMKMRLDIGDDPTWHNAEMENFPPP